MTADELWDTYAGAIIECEFDGRTRCLRGANADALPGAAPIFVLTAYNPGGVERDQASNDADEVRLEQELAGAGMSFWTANGRSPDNSWSEPGVAVVGLDRVAACDLGGRYGQLAVYELTDDAVHVVKCADREIVRARPRRE